MSLLSKFARKKEEHSDIEWVIHHLNDLLNTKRDFGAWQKNLGISDCSTFRNRSDLVNSLMKEIKENLSHYEPRVILAEMQEIPSSTPFHLSFEMACTIENCSQWIYLTLDAKGNKVAVQHAKQRKE